MLPTRRTGARAAQELSEVFAASANADLAASNSESVSCGGTNLRYRGTGEKVMAHSNPIRDSVLQAIVNTPVVRLRKVVTRAMADVLVKLEYYNPTGSYKDRMALAMIEGAEARGELRPGMRVVEWTGGSTGSSLAMVCAIKGYRFTIDERVIVPRSYIGEMLASTLTLSAATYGAFLSNPDHNLCVLDLCTGSGCLAILAALANPQSVVDATDISEGALAVAEQNVADYGLAGRVRLHRGDLFAPLAGKRYDLIISNPPYVTDAAVAAFPPEYAAEPKLAHAGGADGLDLVRRILSDAPGHLEADGKLLVEVGTGQQRLIAEYPELPFLWLDTEESEGEVFLLTAGELREHAPPGKASPRRRRK